MPWRNIARSVIADWEFSMRDYGQSALRRWRLSKSKVHLPPNFYDYDFSIKHLKSGIAFQFSGYDAINKFVQEKQTRNPLSSDFPSYESPLLPISDRQYDSAYVGRVVIEKPGKESEYINPIWDDIHRETLLEQIRWNDINGITPTAPNTSTHWRSGRLFERITLKRHEFLKKYPLVNFVCPLYDSQSDLNKDRKSCVFHLVVGQSVWFVYLYQLFSNFYGVTRTREMTMHCDYRDTVIYREIIERQPKDFEKKLLKDYGEWEERDNELHVCFHEAKQLEIQDLQNGEKQGSESPPVQSPTHFEALNFNGEWMERELFECQDLFQMLEDEIKVPLQIIPLFRHPSPFDSCVKANGRKVSKPAVRKVYKLVSDRQG